MPAKSKVLVRRHYEEENDEAPNDLSAERSTPDILTTRDQQVKQYSRKSFTSSHEEQSTILFLLNSHEYLEFILNIYYTRQKNTKNTRYKTQ